MGKAVFRDYDQQALDAQYNNRDKVADAPRIIAAYSAWSAAARVELRGHLDIAYGDHPAQTLDVFEPRGLSGPRPVNVFIHGGYWKALHKDDHSFVARGLTGAGAICVVVNYALMPDEPMDVLVAQCRRALAWTWRHVARFGGDPSRVFVSGHSAGGHLTATTVATDWPALEAGLPAGLVRGACGISGLYDLEPIRLSYLNDDLRMDEAAAARNSPVRMTPHARCPLLLCVGATEGPEYLRQSETLAAAWNPQGVGCTVEAMAGENHFSIAAQLNEPASALTRMIARQMGL